MKDGNTWKLWFDGQTDLADPAESFLAESTQAAPTHFTIIHKYNDVSGFPGFWEPDVHKRSDNSYAAVVNRGFNSIYYGTSTDGVHFTFQLLLSVTDPSVGSGYVFIDNPALIVNNADEIVGVVYGKSKHPSLPIDHEIGITLFEDPL